MGILMNSCVDGHDRTTEEEDRAAEEAGTKVRPRVELMERNVMRGGGRRSDNKGDFRKF